MSRAECSSANTLAPIRSISAGEPFDFDRIETWGPQLVAILKDLISERDREKLAASRPKYLEDARNHLFDLVDRESIVERVKNWVVERPIFGYHGTRVTKSELDSIRCEGLLPLAPKSRALRLRRALSVHPDWSKIENKLDVVIHELGPGQKCGRREGQVHLTLSRAGLQYGFNHYLKQGSEFDWHAAYALLGEAGQELVAADGFPVIIRVRVPGSEAFAACNPYGCFGTNMPNLVADILRVWPYWLACSDYKSDSLELDCGMVFCTKVPVVWIDDIIEVNSGDLERAD